MTKQESIQVSSHVARDFLQNAAYFNTMPKIIWEYVSNSIDNASDGIPPLVSVEITSHELTILDNGRGMSRNELQNFFQMHGDNIQRQKGKKVRGRFGTGKSAAFGLANYLQIDTVQSGFRNVVELHRDDIDAAKSGDAFPVRDVVINQSTDEMNGTRITIREFNIKRHDIDKIISYIERHLSRFRVRAYVTINQHECKFQEIPFVESYQFTAPMDVSQHIGEVNLTIKVSGTPLDEETNGIDILSYGIWHGTTLAGIEKKERANYIFGEVDVPMLEDGTWLIPPFDNTRNNTLNPQNPAVVVLLGWLSEELEKVRGILVERERTRRKSDEAKLLEQEAEKLADIINDDFAQVELEFETARKIAQQSGRRPLQELPDEQGELWPGTGNEPTQWQQTGNPHGDGKRGTRVSAGDTLRPGPTVKPGTEQGSRGKLSEGNKRLRRGIFSIEYVNASADAPRSTYANDSKTIRINLDHPQIASALRASGGKFTDLHFRQICYEVAAIEYAIAIPHEKIAREELHDAADALFEVKSIVNRITKRLAEALSN